MAASCKEPEFADSKLKGLYLRSPQDMAVIRGRLHVEAKDTDVADQSAVPDTQGLNRYRAARHGHLRRDRVQ